MEGMEDRLLAALLGLEKVDGVEVICDRLDQQDLKLLQHGDRLKAIQHKHMHLHMRGQRLGDILCDEIPCPLCPVAPDLPILPREASDAARATAHGWYDDSMENYQTQFDLYKAWLDEDARASAILVASMEVHLTAKVVNLTSAHLMWTHLRDRYAPTGDALYLAMHSHLDLRRIYDFLTRLRSEYESTRAQLLAWHSCYYDGSSCRDSFRGDSSSGGGYSAGSFFGVSCSYYDFFDYCATSYAFCSFVFFIRHVLLPQLCHLLGVTSTATIVIKMAMWSLFALGRRIYTVAVLRRVLVVLLRRILEVQIHRKFLCYYVALLLLLRQVLLAPLLCHLHNLVLLFLVLHLPLRDHHMLQPANSRTMAAMIVARVSWLVLALAAVTLNVFGSLTGFVFLPLRLPVFLHPLLPLRRLSHSCIID
uniref:Uncharacterized protein n=1 Tax=Oryza brachyantha TaxID=4533 RepID=J3LW87_ORYBR